MLERLTARLEADLDALDAHVGGLYLLSSDREVLDLAVLLGVPVEIAQPWLHVGLATPLPVPEALREKGLVWVGDEEELARRYPRVALSMPFDFRLATLPLARGDTVYGVIFIVWSHAHPTSLSPDEHHAVQALSSDLAQLLEREERADRPIRPPAEPLVVLPDSGRPGTQKALTAMLSRLPEGLVAMDLRARFTYVTEEAAELLGAPAEQLLGAHPWTMLPWLRDPVYEDRYRATLISRIPSSFVALRPPGKWLEFHLYPGGAGLTVRINEADEGPVAHGEIAEPAASPTGPIPASPPPVRAGALYHILHLAGALTEAAGVQDVVSLVADQIVPAFGGQGVVILVAEGRRLRAVGHRGYPPDVVEQLAGTPLTAHTPGVQALVSGVPAFFASREELERLYPFRPELLDGMGAWAYLPLVASGRLVGTCVLAFARPHHFTVDERAVLTALGGLIAQALDRARLYDMKLEVARGLQENLLPRELPVLPGLESAARYLPGTEGMDIGGDFFDILRIGPDRIGAVIGDVQGHNVTAAALMGQLCTAVRAYAASGADPGDVLRQTNRLLFDLEADLLASCIYLDIDLRRRQASLATAGHPPPLLRDPTGAAHLLDLPGGLLLGVDPAATYPVHQVPLPVGTVVALYTDGLVEVPGVDFDEALAKVRNRLARLASLPLNDLAGALISRAEQVRHRTDDIAVLLLRSVPA